MPGSVTQQRSGSWSVFGVPLPEYGITERLAKLASGGKTTDLSSAITGSSHAATPSVLGAFSTPTPTPSAQSYANHNSTGPLPGGGSTGGTYSQTQSTGQYAPAISGQSSAATGGGYDALQSLRDAFGQQRSAIEGQLPALEGDYNQSKSDIEASVNRAQDTLNTQKDDLNRTYGQNLKQLLQTDQELRQRRQGTFSALNTLDSSAYRDDVTKGDQALQDNQNALVAERDRNIQGADKEFAAYQQQATSQLAQVANEFTRAKAALRQAVADVNLNEASSIQNYMQQLQDRAQAVQDQMNAFKMNLAQLQAQGVNVVGNLKNFNMNDFSQQFGQGLQNTLQNVTARYSLPQSTAAGSGYINPKTGKAYTDEERRLLGI